MAPPSALGAVCLEKHRLSNLPRPIHGPVVQAASFIAGWGMVMKMKAFGSLEWF